MSSAFIGSWPSEIAAVFTASAITSRPLLVVGDSGLGKTTILNAITSFYAGGDEDQVWIRSLSPGDSPAIINGTIDVSELVERDAVRMTRSGTPYDPRFRVVVFDEMTRANEAALHAMLPLFDVRQRDPLVPKVATSNFSIQHYVRSERASARTFDALMDRIALQVWMGAPSIMEVRNASAVIDSTAAQEEAMTFADLQWLAWIDPNPSLRIPRALEISAFERVIRSGAMRPIYLQIAKALIDDKQPPYIVHIARNLAENASELLGTPPSRRRHAILTELLVRSSLLDLFRNADPDRWQEAHRTNHPEAWQSLSDAIIRDHVPAWNVQSITERIAPLAAVALRFAIVSPDENVSKQWLRHVESLIGGTEYVHHLVQEAYHICIGAAAPVVDLARLRAIIDELQTRNEFAARLCHVYAALAEGMMHGDQNAQEKAIQWMRTLDPSVWPLPKSVLEQANALFQEIDRRLSSSRQTGVRRVKRV